MIINGKLNDNITFKNAETHQCFSRTIHNFRIIKKGQNMATSSITFGEIIY